MPDQVEPNDVERIRVAGDLRLRQMELEIRKSELEFQKEKWAKETDKESGWSLASLGPSHAVVIAAVIAVIGGAIGASVTGCSNLALEKEKLRSGLILKSVETRDQNEVAKMLRFLVDIGLLEDTKGKIAESLKTPERLPVRPRPTGPGYDYGDYGYDDYGYGNWGGYSNPRNATPHTGPK